MDLFGILTLCDDKQCGGDCGRFHPSCEESGAESAVLDVWGFFWHRYDGSKVVPNQAEVLSVYLRVLESNAEAVHCLSGSHGVFFEPRLTEAPGPDPAFSVLWLPKCSLQEAIHKVRTTDQLIAVCRLGMKYGVRCHAKHEELMNQELRPDKPFVQCEIKQVYRMEPIPVGTQRHSLVEMLKTMKWQARPLQPIRGTQGRAWQIGAAGPPPTPFCEAKHGYCTITKIKDTVTTYAPAPLVATMKTRQHIIGQPGVASQDPWQHGDDPWSLFQGVNRPAASSSQGPSTHVQKKFEDVEQRIQDQVASHVKKTLDDHQKATVSHGNQVEARVGVVEGQLQALIESQTKMQHWIQADSQRISSLQHAHEGTQVAVQQCVAQLTEQGQALTEQGQAVQGVAQEMNKLQTSLKTTLDDYFQQQAEKLDSLLSKRQRTDA